MGKLKTAFRKLATPKDISYKDPYALVIRLARERKAYGLWGAFFLGVGFLLLMLVGAAGSIPVFEPYLAAAWHEAMIVGFSAAVVAGVFLGLYAAATYCRESLNSVIPFKWESDDPA